MRISVAVHGYFQDIASIGRDEVVITLPDSGSYRIRDLLDHINLLEEEIRRVTLNGRAVRLDTILRHRVKLEFFPRRYRVARPHHPNE